MGKPAAGPVDLLPLWLFVLAIAAVVVLSIEFGYRFGRYRRQQAEDEREAPVGAIVAATLGLLAFILAFTFGLAASRFDARRQIVVEEANAIGTAYLRAGFLEETESRTVRSLLQQYIRSRLEVVETGNAELALQQADELHQRLWRLVESSARKSPDSIPVGLFAASINEVIDIHSRRVLVALQSRLPTILWVTLFVVTVATMSGVGYHEGLSRSRRSPVVAILVLAFSAVMSLIADLDRPQEGTLRVNQQALRSLESLIQQHP